MTSRTAALRYARALFDVALAEHGDLAAIGDAIAGFDDLLRRHDALRTVLLNPAVPAPRKRDAVAALLKLVSLPAPVSKLLVLLAERDRLAIVPDIVAAFRERLLQHQHVVRAQVVTAAPLGAAAVQEIEARLAQATGRHVRLSAAVDPSIIGGIITRIGSTVYDGSITGQLARMKQKFEAES